MEGWRAPTSDAQDVVHPSQLTPPLMGVKFKPGGKRSWSELEVRLRGGQAAQVHQRDPLSTPSPSIALDLTPERLQMSWPLMRLIRGRCVNVITL